MESSSVVDATSSSGASVEKQQMDDVTDKELEEAADAEAFIQNHAIKMVEYEKQMFLDALHSDALIVCAK